jgi:hypothetical protein
LHRQHFRPARCFRDLAPRSRCRRRQFKGSPRACIFFAKSARQSRGRASHNSNPAIAKSNPDAPPIAMQTAHKTTPAITSTLSCRDSASAFVGPAAVSFPERQQNYLKIHREIRCVLPLLYPSPRRAKRLASHSENNQQREAYQLCRCSNANSKLRCHRDRDAGYSGRFSRSPLTFEAFAQDGILLAVSANQISDLAFERLPKRRSLD